MLEIIEFIGLVSCAVGVSVYGIYQINLMSKK
jgi:hypothetical protein